MTLESKPTGLVSQLAEQVGAMIRTENWPVGSALPPTRQLAKRFGVSLTTAQGAVRALAEAGVVDLRPRRGAFIKTAEPRLGEYRSARQVAVISWDVQSHADILYAGSGVEDMFRGVDQGLRVRDYHMATLFYEGWEKDSIQAAIRRLEGLGENLAGVIVFARPETIPLIDECESRKLPCVSINAPHRGAMYNYVSGDNEEGGWRIGQCLLRMKKHRVLCLHVKNSSQAGFEKITGLYSAFVESFAPTNGIELTALSDTVPEDTGGYNMTCEYLASHSEPPEVIYSASDYSAMGAIHACKERGLKVPDDVGVIGCSGLNFGVGVHPALTTMAEPMREIGRVASEMLIEMIDTGTGRLPGRRIPSVIYFRESLRVPQEVQDSLERMYRHQVEETAWPGPNHTPGASRVRRPSKSEK